MRRFALAFVLLFVAAQGSAQTTQPASQPATQPTVSVSDLINAIPRLSDRDPSLSSFRVKGVASFTGESFLGFDVAYSREHGRMVRMFDPNDQTTAFYFAQGLVYLYDPVNGRLLKLECPGPTFSLVAPEGKLSLNCAFSTSSDDKFAEIWIPLRDIFPANTRMLLQAQDDRTQLLAVQLANGKLGAGAMIDTHGNKPRLQSLQLGMPADNRLLLKIESVSVNEPLSPTLFRAPVIDPSQLGALVYLRPHEDAEHAKLLSTDNASALTAAVSSFIRAGLSDKKMRPMVEQQLKRSLDWDAVSTLDRSRAPIVRKVLPPPAEE